MAMPDFTIMKSLVKSYGDNSSVRIYNTLLKRYSPQSDVQVFPYVVWTLFPKTNWLFVLFMKLSPHLTSSAHLDPVLYHFAYTCLVFQP